MRAEIFSALMHLNYQMTRSGGFKIGMVAARTGLSIDTIRFYERLGLLERVYRTESGYRVYQREDIEVLQFVKRSREMGFSLKEIGQFLFLRLDPRACKCVQEVLQKKLAITRAKLIELQKIETELVENLARCQKTARSSSASDCPLVMSLERGTGINSVFQSARQR